MDTKRYAEAEWKTAIAGMLRDAIRRNDWSMVREAMEGLDQDELNGAKLIKSLARDKGVQRWLDIDFQERTLVDFTELADESKDVLEWVKVERYHRDGRGSYIAACLRRTDREYVVHYYNATGNFFFEGSYFDLEDKERAVDEYRRRMRR